MTVSAFIYKVLRKWIKLRLQPIRIFCLHHVCEQFDADAMYPCDWMALDVFQHKIHALRTQGYQFISLTEAYKHLKTDCFRRKKYAVLTFDDGYKSLQEVLPWLEEQQIPATLFINGKYLDGKSYRDTPKEQYLTYDELFSLTSSLIEVGHHGWEHVAAIEMTEEELTESLQKNRDILSSHPRYIPFLAYTYGKWSDNAQYIIKKSGITPVMVSSSMNYNNSVSIDREPLYYIDKRILQLGICRNIDLCQNCIYKFE